MCTVDDAVARSLKTTEEVTANRASKMELLDFPSLERSGNFQKISLRRIYVDYDDLTNYHRTLKWPFLQQRSNTVYLELLKFWENMTMKPFSLLKRKLC